MRVYDNIVIGGGYYGLNKFLSLNPNDNNLLIDNNTYLGGFLIDVYKVLSYEDINYVHLNKLIDQVNNLDSEIMLDTFVTNINLSASITCNNSDSTFDLKYKNLHVCTGVIEVNPWQQSVETRRINGVYNLECVMNHIKLDHKLRGSDVLILNSNEYSSALIDILKMDYNVMEINVETLCDVKINGSKNIESINILDTIYKCDILVIPGGVYVDDKLVNLYNKNIKLNNQKVYEYNQFKN